MLLHLDKENFKKLIDIISTRTDIDSDIIEKEILNT